MRLKSLYQPIPYIVKDSDSYLVKQFFQYVSSPTAQAILAIIIVFINCLLINRTTIKNHISKENTLVPGMLFALFSAILPEFLSLSPALLASTFVILSLSCIFNCYNNLKCADDIFLAGFFMSLASLIYFPLIIFFFFIIIGFLIMRSFTLKENIQHLAGWLSCFFIVYALQYFNKAYDQLLIPYYLLNKINYSNIMDRFNIENLIVLIFIGLFILIFLFNYGNYSGKKVISGQKRVSILFWFLVFNGLSIFFYKDISLQHVILFLIPFSIFLSVNLLDMKNKIWPELVHLFFVLILVIIHLDLIKI
jgi:hypothetical protein